MHDTVRFHATAFNTSEPRDYFINDTCFGDDFGQWLKPRLTEVGYEVFGPEQEDWGWYLDCRLGDTKRTLNVGYIGEPDNVWQLIVQEPVTLVERLFGRMKSVSNQLQMDLHRILDIARDTIRDIEWLYVDSRGQESGDTSPGATGVAPDKIQAVVPISEMKRTTGVRIS